MKKIIEYLLNKPKMVNFTLLLIVIGGILAIINIKKEGYESVDYGGVNISTVYPGASPRDVEVKVTSKIEKQLKNVSGIDWTRSTSIENYSHIEVMYVANSDFDKVSSDIRKAIDRVTDFPPEVKERPMITELSEDTRPMLEIAITGPANYDTKRRYAKALEDSLNATQVVGQIKKNGYLKREVYIEVSQMKLKEYYVSLGEVMDAIKKHNFRMSAGDLLQKGEEKKYVVMSEFDQYQDVGEVIIRSGFGSNRVLVSDVAIVKTGYEKPKTDVRYNGVKSINFILIKKPDIDIIQAVKRVNMTLQEFRENLPDDVKVETIVDYSAEVRRLLGLTTTNALIGFIFVLIILLLTLNPRIAIWTAIGIPTSIFIAFILFPLVNVTIHYISLVAIILVLGMLVDDAIIIAENIYRHREQGLNANVAVIKGLQEVSAPVFTTILTTIIVFMPIAGMSESMGKIFRSIPWVVLFLLSGSLLESFFFLPTHIAHMKMSNFNPSGKIFEFLGRAYQKLVRFTLKHKIVTIFSFVIILLISIFLMVGSLRFKFFETTDSDSFMIKYETQKGMSLETTGQLTRKIEAVLLQLPEEELHGFVTIVGEDKPYGDPSSFGHIIYKHGHLGNIFVHLQPMDTRKRTSPQIISEIKAKLKDLPGFSKIKVEISNQAPSEKKAISLTTIYHDDHIRKKITGQIMTLLKEHPDVTNVEDDREEGKKKISINFDYQKLSQLGLKPYQVANTIRAGFNGVVVTSLYRQGEDIDFRVILDKKSRTSFMTISDLTIQNIGGITVENNQGRLIPIGNLISKKEEKNRLSISHYQGIRSTKITADLKEGNDAKKITAITNLVKKETSASLKKYPGLRLKVGGELEVIGKSMVDFGIAFMIAILAIYFILVILFNSFYQPLLVMLAIPFAFSGVVFAFFIHGMSIGLPAAIGFLGLTGVVVNDSLVMITFLNKKCQQSGMTIDTIAEGAKSRLRPILLTTLTTAVALFPMAYGLGGSNRFAGPMVMAIAWGLVFATFVTLLLLPALYLSFGKLLTKKKK